MADNPSWLQSSNAAPTPPPAEVFSLDNPTAVTGSTTSSNRAASVALTPEEEKDLPGIILIMRLANMGVAVALMTASILVMIGFPSISNWVLAIYATCGGLLICCLETQLKFLRVIIAVNFGFLFNSIWRFFFYALLSSVSWAYNTLLGKIVCIAMLAMGLFNTYILCRYPGYRKIREQIAEEEDKRIEARISKEVKKQAISSMTSGR